MGSIMETSDVTAKLTGGFDPLTESASLGWEQYKYVGRTSLPILQMAGTIASFRQPMYDNVRARLRMHVILYWKAGYFKSSILDTFINRCNQTVNIMDQPEYRNDEISYLDATHQSCARLRGSINNGKPAYPLIQRPVFTVSSELMNLLGGGGESTEEVVNLLNQMLEEGRVSVSLVKMVGQELDQATLDEMANRGIKWNQKEGMMAYECGTTLLTASRPIDEHIERRLINSGFFDRQNVVRWWPSEEEFDEQWLMYPPNLPQERFDALRGWNERLWATEWKTVNAPPVEMLTAAKKTLSSLYDVVEKKHRKSKMAGLRTARDNTNLAHLCTVFGVIETLRGDNSKTQDKIRYEPAVLERLKLYLPEYIKSRTPWG